MMRLSFRWLLVCVALAGSAAFATPDATGSLDRKRGRAKPNILFIFSDDHSCQTIGAYNRRLSAFVRAHNITPNLDRLAEQGVVFDQSFCATSICSSSRATVMTGMHAHRTGVTGLNGSIPNSLWSFPPALQDAGYETALFGKWHLESAPKGFDYYRILYRQGSYWNPEFRGPAGLKKRDTGYTTDLITDRALGWLKKRDASSPFMLMVHHKAPHQPCQPPTRYFKLLADVELPEPSSLFDDFSGRSSSPSEYDARLTKDLKTEFDLKVMPPGKLPRNLPSSELKAFEEAFGERNIEFLKGGLTGADLVRWKYQEYNKDYLRCIKAVDDSVGRLMAYLEQEGLADNTLIIYSADQGYFHGEHGWFDKRWMYEESMRMPLIMRWPAHVKRGTRIPQLVQNIDYAPTFMEIAGLDVPEAVQGHSLLPLLQGHAPADWRRGVYYRTPRGGVPQHYGIRTERYTLIHFFEANEWELYDLKRDPQQLQSVHDHPEFAKTRDKLKLELSRLRSHYQAPEEMKSSGKRRPSRK